MPPKVENKGTIAWKENTFQEFKQNYDMFMLVCGPYKENEIVRDAIYELAENEAKGGPLPDPAKFHKYFGSAEEQVALRLNEGHQVVDVNKIPTWYHLKDYTQGSAGLSTDARDHCLDIWDGMDDNRFNDMNDCEGDELLVTSNGAYSGKFLVSFRVHSKAFWTFNVRFLKVNC